jgi:hypothetical protein
MKNRAKSAVLKHLERTKKSISDKIAEMKNEFDANIERLMRSIRHYKETYHASLTEHLYNATATIDQ